MEPRRIPEIITWTWPLSAESEAPSLPFDLPTQCGYDSDDPMSEGEVGKTGIAMDTLRDMEVVFEAFPRGSWPR